MCKNQSVPFVTSALPYGLTPCEIKNTKVCKTQPRMRTSGMIKNNEQMRGEQVEMGNTERNMQIINKYPGEKKLLNKTGKFKLYVDDRIWMCMLFRFIFIAHILKPFKTKNIQ